MKNQVNRGGTGLIMAVSVVCFTGCVCPKKSAVCLENESRGYATIVCQPSDTEVSQGQQAVFKVDATGKSLTYQWFFKGNTGLEGDVVDPTLTTGGQTPTLIVNSVNSAKGGLYWCDIESETSLGQPTLTRTRNAHLGIRAATGGGSGGGVQTFPPQQAYAPPKKTSSSTCGSHCSWVNFQNGGAGFDPNAGFTIGHAKVRIGTGGFLPQTAFHLKWFDSAGGSGCAANSSSPNTRKQFPIDPSKIYFFTVYLTSSAPCPAAGTSVYLDELTFE